MAQGAPFTIMVFSNGSFYLYKEQFLIQRYIFILVLMALLMAAVSGCKPKEAECGSRVTGAGAHDNICGFYVPSDASRADLSLQIMLRRGNMSWDLEDPQGKVMWSGSADSSQPVYRSASIDQPAPGRWNLKIHLDGAVGEYSAPWTVEE